MKLDFLVVLSGMQRVEVGEAVNAEHHRLAVNDELPVLVFQGGSRFRPNVLSTTSATAPLMSTSVKVSEAWPPNMRGAPVSRV
jgi:hypothetical protein